VVFLTGVGSLVLGLVLMVICNIVRPAFFRGQTLDKGTGILVPEDAPLEEIAPVPGA
jgi:hypothetical protein